MSFRGLVCAAGRSLAAEIGMGHLHLQKPKLLATSLSLPALQPVFMLIQINPGHLGSTKNKKSGCCGCDKLDVVRIIVRIAPDFVVEALEDDVINRLAELIGSAKLLVLNGINRVSANNLVVVCDQLFDQPRLPLFSQLKVVRAQRLLAGGVINGH
jgi:hypothetical protein